MMKKFAIIGAAGYIAPRHMKAIQDTKNELVAALDKNDSVGIIDSYFPRAEFFTEFERFDRHISKMAFDENEHLDYVAICTPNYLHDANIRFALRNNADAICEKPLVLNPWNIDALKEQEKITGKKVHTILQLRLHPSIIALKEKVASAPKDRKYEIDLTYLTSRGKWYHRSWKGEHEKSGGLATNIGIHFFDMLGWVFGDLQESKVSIKNHDVNSGYLEFENARVRWFLSINSDYLPEEAKQRGLPTYRSITIDGEEIEFSQGFKDLHTRSYEEIINGNGFGLDEAYPSIDIVHQIRNAEVEYLNGVGHPMVRNSDLFKQK